MGGLNVPARTEIGLAPEKLVNWQNPHCHGKHSPLSCNDLSSSRVAGYPPDYDRKRYGRQVSSMVPAKSRRNMT